MEVYDVMAGTLGAGDVCLLPFARKLRLENLRSGVGADRKAVKLKLKRRLRGWSAPALACSTTAGMECRFLEVEKELKSNAFVGAAGLSLLDSISSEKYLTFA